VNTSGSTTRDETSGQMTKETAAVLSASVERIVESTLNLGFGREACTTAFGHLIERDQINAALTLASTSTSTSSLAAECLGLLKKDSEMADAHIRIMKAQARLVDKLADNMLELIKTGKISSHDVKDIITPSRPMTPMFAPPK
jgi:hypothetical protein